MTYSIYVLDSSDAPNPNAPTFGISANPFVARFKVLSAHIPATFRSTGSHNNTIAIRENGGTPRILNIPPGDYNPGTFPGVLKNLLGGSYDVVYDETQRNIKVTNPNVSFSILGLSGGTNAFGILGKSRDNDSTSANAW